MEDIFKYLIKDMPTWKVVLIDKWTDFRVWLWLKMHHKLLRERNNS